MSEWFKKQKKPSRNFFKLLQEHMLSFLTSSPHLKAMKKYYKIGSGKVYGYKANSIPSWEDVFVK